MPSPAHETLVALPGQRPDLLDLLLRTLGYAGLPGDVSPVDSPPSGRSVYARAPPRRQLT